MACQQGRDTLRKPAEVFRVFDLAARNGVPEAQYNPALMYVRGEGVGRDAFQGVTWMRRAYLTGIRAAMPSRSGWWRGSGPNKPLSSGQWHCSGGR